MNSKKHIFSLLRILTFTVVLVLLFSYALEQKDELSILRRIDFSDIFWIFWAVFLYNFINALKFFFIYRIAGASLGIWESFGLSIVATTTNLILPGQAGGIVRGIYLHRLYQVPFSKVPALMLGATVLNISLAGIVLLIINFALIFQGRMAPPIIWIISLLASAAILSLWIKGPGWLSRKSGRILNMTRLFFEAWIGFRQNTGTLMLICLLQLLGFLSSGIVLWLVFRSLEVQVDVLSATVLITATTPLSVVNILPGNVGLLEATIAYLSSISGINFMHGLLAAGIRRIISTVFVLALLPISWFLLFKRKNILLITQKRE